MPARGSTGIRLSVAAEQQQVIAPGTARFVVRVQNTTSHAYSGLRIGIDSVVDHQPEGGGSASPPLPGPCGAAAGTGYCGFPVLAAHSTAIEVISVRVPLHFPPATRSTAGHDVQVGVFLDRGKTGGLPLTPVRHAQAQIAAPVSPLPFTGFAATNALLLAAALVFGGLLAMIAARRRGH